MIVNFPISRRQLLLAAASSTLLGRNALAADTGGVLLHDAHIVSMDPAIGDLDRGDVLVRAGRIVAVGARLDAPGAERIDMRGRVLMPGFVDTHWHMWNSIARGFDSSSVGPFTKTMAALAKVWTPAASALSVKLACAQAVEAGITTVNNWAHNIKSPDFADAELTALRASGLRGRFSFGYPQALLPDELMDLTALEDIKRREFRSAGLIDLGVSMRGPDRSAPAIWRREIAAARALGLPVTMHLASDRASAAKGFISVMHAEKFLGPDVQVVHATHASKRDLALLKDAGSPLSISPWTELEVGYGVPPLADMAASGVEMGLSVDNMILAGQADMFSVMRLAIDLAAGQRSQQGVIPNRRALEWATIGGARGLGISSVTGSLTPGKRADLIAIDKGALNTMPVRNVDIMLTHSARPSDVDLVMIDGVVHKRDKRLVGLDVAALLSEAEQMITQLRTQAKI